MIKISIFTSGKSGQKLYKYCKKISSVQVISFVDNNANLYAKKIEGIPVISPYMLRNQMQSGDIDMVLVPSDRMVSYGLREYTLQLDNLDIRKYKIIPAYLTKKEDFSDIDVKQMEEIIYNGEYRKINQLQHLQFHVIDNCNLNCRRCQHFSNIANKDSFADFNSVERDFIRIKELVDDIGTIAVLGGEPLLNKELPQYIKMIRGLFPNSTLEVITNGLLVKQMDNELIETIKTNNVLINISYYPVLENTIEKIVKFLSENGIRFYIGPHIDSFSKRLVEDKNYDDLTTRFETCRDACCTTLRNHKIYPCYLPATSFIINEKMGTHICNDDCGIDIYSAESTGIDIVERLKRPFEACAYCGRVETYDWEQTKHVSREDWLV